MSSVYLRDARLQGVAYAVNPNSTQVAVVCPNARRVSMLMPAIGRITYQGDVVLPLVPGAIVADASNLYVLARDTLYKLTIASTPVLSATYALGANTLRALNWAFLFEGRIICPWGSTGIQVLTTAGVVVSTHPELLSTVSQAALDPVGRRIYAIDGTTGRGVVLSISTAGLLTYRGSFLAPNVQPCTGMAIDGTTLVVTTDHRLMTFSLADPDAPTAVTTTTYSSTINGVTVIAAGHYWLVTTENNATQSYPYTFGDSLAIIGPAGLFVCHSSLGRVSCSTTATAIDGTVVTFSVLGSINGLQFNGTVFSMALQGSTLYLGGSFTSVTDASGAKTRNNLCAVDIGTGLVTSFDPNMNGGVIIVRADSSGNIWVGGSFTQVGGLNRGHLCFFSSAGVLNAFDGQANGDVYGIAFGNGLVYVNGQFTSIGGASRGLAGAFNASTLLITSLDPQFTGGSSHGRRCLVSATGDAYYSGDFTASQGVQHNGGAAFTSAGVLKAFNPGLAGLSATGDGMAELSSLLYIGGDFNSAGVGGGAQSRNRIAAFDYSGTLQAFSVSLNLSCYTIAVDPVRAVVYAGGNFTNAGAARRFAAAFGTDSSLKPWDPGLTGGTILYEFLFSAPYVFMCGDFTNPSGGVGIYVTPAA